MSFIQLEGRTYLFDRTGVDFSAFIPIGHLRAASQAFNVYSIAGHNVQLAIVFKQDASELMPLKAMLLPRHFSHIPLKPPGNFQNFLVSLVRVLVMVGQNSMLCKL